MDKNTFYVVVKNIVMRTKLLQMLNIDDRIEVSRIIESYQAIQFQRSKLIGKTYGNRAVQKKDAELKSICNKLKEKFDVIASPYWKF